VLEGNPARQKVAFAVIVFALVGLGAYLLRPTVGSSTGSGGHGPAPAVSSQALQRSSMTQAPGAGSSSTASPSTSTAPIDVYRLLPFSQAGLDAAVSVTTRFANAYGTFSYTQDATAYIAPMQAFCVPPLAAQIKAAYSLPGVASVRTSKKQVSAGSSVIESIRAFGSHSLTFLVQVTQRLTELTGSKVATTEYAVTVTGSGTSWQVSDIELATAGNS